MLAAIVCLMAMPARVAAGEYHVAVSGDDANAGSPARPFRTISAAARAAQPGDIVTVHGGTYRERVNPPRGGTSADRRITYQAAAGENVVIKGSEIVRGWERFSPGVWKVTLPNSFFGAFNPYRELIKGDWYFGEGLHLGGVFVNGRALREVKTLAQVTDPRPTPDMRDPADPAWVWFCTGDRESVTLYANFQNRDPSRDEVEISVRETCFYPGQTGCNFITLRGFHLSQAATQWAAPTAEQVGLVGTNWSKGWIIEDNVISESKCVGLTLGKDRQTGNNGVDYNEMVHRVIAAGWNEAHIGSHLVRRNTIFQCGAAGICGSFGAAFSRIEDNHVYDIYTYRPYWGAEIAGIKIHGAIDVLIRHNRVHNAYIGIWLDWMAQGTRVSGNLCYENDYVDFFPEVDHGPYLADNNLLLSGFAIKDWSQGGAYVHNLIAGLVSRAPQARKTPFFRAHSTEFVRIENIRGGDNRFFNNVFVGVGNGEVFKKTDYLPHDAVDADSGYGLALYDHAALPVQAGGNVYLRGAVNLKSETGFQVQAGFEPAIRLVEQGSGVTLTLTAPGLPTGFKTKTVTTALLGRAVVPEEGFENPDGSPLTIDTDYLGNPRPGDPPAPGPFARLPAGTQSWPVW